jgi:hypothetical protein
LCSFSYYLKSQCTQQEYDNIKQAIKKGPAKISKKLSSALNLIRYFDWMKNIPDGERTSASTLKLSFFLLLKNMGRKDLPAEALEAIFWALIDDNEEQNVGHQIFCRQ